MTEKLWLTWEDHRRSRELSKALGANYRAVTIRANRAIRYPVLSVKTIYILFKNRPKILFCQNPSIVLASLACALKSILKYRLVVDRHTNFKFHKSDDKALKWKLFRILSDYSIRNADLTIVTNKYLENYINQKSGKGFVLQDKLPDLSGGYLGEALKGSFNVTFVSTFSEDEPIDQVVNSARFVPDDVHIYITGNYKKYRNLERLMGAKPNNVTLTGFISESEYKGLLRNSDAMIVITEQEYTLTCGAYEAVSLGKPMILGNTQAIREYFDAGAEYTSTDEEKIAIAMLSIRCNLERKASEVAGLRSRLKVDWDERFRKLQQVIQDEL